ncbi:hypothetical protein WISP_83674 [Willisornis vidua]|uniref:Uncharacterized protein n=1 Tax=Willisornis vidua TaxID=1566151 RepID=A0ABQ9D3P4_9PASS|nr:hypothetical protein WISP_83674 [Willisornis vidua]
MSAASKMDMPPAKAERCAEGGGEGAPGTGAVLQTACGVAHGEAAVPLQPMEDHGGAEIHLQPMEETHARAGVCLKEGCEPVGNL